MKLLTCPRCREIEPDTIDHATGIRLCDKCQTELGAALLDERAGARQSMSRRDALREAYEEGLAEAMQLGALLRSTRH